MKTIGLLGGMSWESTAEYYKIINENIKKELGGLHSAEIAMYSVDFAEIEKLQSSGEWEESGKFLAGAAKAVQAAGADFLVLCTNTMHKVVPQIEQQINIPVLHIADATAERLLKDNIKTAGLLGTKFTMEEDFLKGRIKDKFGIDILIPGVAERKAIHRIIYEELCVGILDYDSEQKFLEIIRSLGNKGAEAIILGCTEIGMLVGQEDTGIPLYDTTEIHAVKAVEESLGV